MTKKTSHVPFLMAALALTMLAAACGELATPTTIAPTPTTVKSAATVVPATPTNPPAPPTATPIPPTATSTVTPNLGGQDALAAQLVELVRPSLPTPPATPGPGRMDISVMPLKTNIGGLWLAYSTGMRSFQPLINHFVAVYTHSAAGWLQASRLEIPGPDYLNAQAIKQVQVDPERIWLQIDGGAGAHSGAFALVSFDGKALRLEVENAASSPGSSRVEDLNGDKLGDVILDHTDYYIFCYACGVRYFQYEVRTWDGAKLAPVKLAALRETAPANVRKLNDQAIAQAGAGLWKDAQTTVAQIKSVDPIFIWNAALIKLHADLFAKQAESGPYPLLDNFFYGDYAATLDVMRALPPEQLFDAKSPLVTVQIAQGWEKSISQWITKTTTLALGVQPDLAAAYFLRGWALNLAQPGSAVALADIEKAAQLAPSETVFAASVQYLRKR